MRKIYKIKVTVLFLFLRNLISCGLHLEKDLLEIFKCIFSPGQAINQKEKCSSTKFTNPYFLSSYFTLYFPCLRQVWVFNHLINPYVFIC